MAEIELQSSSESQLTLQNFLCDLNPPMPHLVQPLTEVGITDDALHTLVGWSSRDINEFFEELIKPKILDLFQSFVMKRKLLALGSQQNEQPEVTK